MSCDLDLWHDLLSGTPGEFQNEYSKNTFCNKWPRRWTVDRSSSSRRVDEKIKFWFPIIKRCDRPRHSLVKPLTATLLGWKNPFLHWHLYLSRTNPWPRVGKHCGDEKKRNTYKHQRHKDDNWYMNAHFQRYRRTNFKDPVTQTDKKTN